MITNIRGGLPSLVLGVGFAFLMALPALAANSVKSGQLNVERPTLISEGFDWRIEGDDNRNATVTVKYRKKGDGDWQTGLPFLRAGGNGETVGVSAGPGEGGAPAAAGGAAAGPPQQRFEQFKYVDAQHAGGQHLPSSARHRL